MMCIVQTRRHAQKRNVSREGLENAYITTEGGQDKRSRGAALSGGWYDWFFQAFALLVENMRDAHTNVFVNSFSENRTSRRCRP